MASIKDITGRTFGRLKVIEKVPHLPCEVIKWECECTCGSIVKVKGTSLRNGHKRSCGCLSRETASKGNSTHGKCYTPENNIWRKMRRRCASPKDSRYEDYGGRGIKVCDRWVRDFQNFYDDMGPRPSKEHSIDRIDNDGDYTPENCRWATHREQANNKRNTPMLTLGPITDTFMNWSRITGINYMTLRSRVFDFGWTDEKALTTEVAR